MVTGIRKFREHFAAHEGQYAIIGGAACDHRRDSAHTVQGPSMSRPHRSSGGRRKRRPQGHQEASQRCVPVGAAPARRRIRQAAGVRPPGPSNLCRQDAGRRNAGSQGVRRAVQPKRGGQSSPQGVWADFMMNAASSALPRLTGHCATAPPAALVKPLSHREWGLP